MNLMKKVGFALLLAAVFVAGSVFGYRATMHNLSFELMDCQTIAVTAWGQTDTYHDCTLLGGDFCDVCLEYPAIPNGV